MKIRCYIQEIINPLQQNVSNLYALTDFFWFADFKFRPYLDYVQNKNNFVISSRASKPINIRWIRTGSQPYWKIIYNIISQAKLIFSLLQVQRSQCSLFRYTRTFIGHSQTCILRNLHIGPKTVKNFFLDGSSHLLPFKYYVPRC